MVGVFVQVNTGSRKAKSNPIGYVIEESGCWGWVGSKNHMGYGMWFFKGKMTPAHRAVYLMHKGEIPVGLFLDHLCRNPSCVNPDHLEPVTHRENVLRGVSPMAKNAVKTHCDNGHPFSPENTYLPSRGGRQCRACGTANKIAGRKTHCPRGHEYTETTSRFRPRGGPICLICHPHFPRLRGVR